MFVLMQGGDDSLRVVVSSLRLVPASMCNVVKEYIFNVNAQFSTVAGQNVLGGAQLGQAKHRGVPGKPLKIFEIFIPEIAENASNFKN